MKEAGTKANEFSNLDDPENFYDFVTIFDCRKKEVILEIDNIPF